VPLHEFPFVLVVGLAVGSFANVLIWRVPRRLSVNGRSRCPACGKTLSPFELVPVASFLLQRGKCRGCDAGIATRYPLVEMTGALLFFLGWWASSGLIAGLLLGLALTLLFALAMIDLETGLIPDALTIAVAATGLLHALLLGGLSISAPLLGGGFFFVQWAVSRGRFVGSGDIGLGMAIGFVLNAWQDVALALMLSYMLGASIAAALLLTGRAHRKSTIPFGPFLAAGTVLAVALRDLPLVHESFALLAF